MGFDSYICKEYKYIYTFMKKNLIIKNVGPIEDVNLEFRRFNFLIGPQSSGKSTIAKVLSTCCWTEKEVETTMNEKAIKTPEDFISLIEIFHNMDNYFSERSEIHYESDFVSIDLLGKKSFKISIKPESNYQRCKICYIPAERNFVTLNALEGFEFGPTNLRSFLFDWFKARTFYTADNKSEILNLGIRYYYDPMGTRYKDHVDKNDDTYDISLRCASSGIQSLVPLYVMVLYYTDQYFKTFNQVSSFEMNERSRLLWRRITDEYILKVLYPDYSTARRGKFLTSANKLLQERDPRMMKVYAAAHKIFDNLAIPVKSSFIIEEPEQNLFPDTQVDFIERLVELCNKKTKYKHDFTITTHSPYVLNMLNLLFKRFDAGDTSAANLNFDDVTVNAVDNGTITDLKIRNENTHLIDPRYLSAPLDRIYNKYEAL